MELPIHQFNLTVINAQSMGDNITGTAVNINEVITYAVQAVWSAGSTPVGSLSIKGSNNNIDYTEVSASSISGNSGSIIVNVEKPGYAWVRVDYVRTSGDGTLSCTVNSKRL